jgi:predicted phage-related endonuclease
MKRLKFDTREEWLAARRGRITGTRLKDIVVKSGKGKKLGYYELIAERIGIPADGEDPMERGARLQDEAIAHFEVQTGKKVKTELEIWCRDDNNDIAISPDGSIGKTEAVEVKCLSSARHIQALLTNEVPDEYHYQSLQYFVVNDSLKTLYFAFYDPRVLAKDFFYFTINRKDMEDEIIEFLAYQKTVLEEIELIVNNLTKF